MDELSNGDLAAIDGFLSKDWGNREKPIVMNGKLADSIPDRYRGMSMLNAICLEIEKRIKGKCSVEENFAARAYDFRWQPRGDDKVYQMRVMLDEFTRYSSPNSDVVGWICDRLEDGRLFNLNPPAGQKITNLFGMNPAKSASFGVGAYIRNSLKQAIGQVQAAVMSSTGPVGPGGPEYIELNLKLRCKTADIMQILLDEQRMKEVQPVGIIPMEGISTASNKPSDIRFLTDYVAAAPTMLMTLDDGTQVTVDSRDKDFFMSEAEIAEQERKKNSKKRSVKEYAKALDQYFIETVAEETVSKTPPDYNEPYSITDFIEELD